MDPSTSVLLFLSEQMLNIFTNFVSWQAPIFKNKTLRLTPFSTLAVLPQFNVKILLEISRNKLDTIGLTHFFLIIHCITVRYPLILLIRTVETANQTLLYVLNLVYVYLC